MSNTNTSPDGTIPVDVAKEWAQNWRNFIDVNQTDFIARSFLIPIIDFKNILLYNPDAEAVRAYLGLETPADPLSAKLMLVPVTAGEEVLVIPLGGVNASAQSNVYDFSKVCPPDCPLPPSDTLES